MYRVHRGSASLPSALLIDLNWLFIVGLLGDQVSDLVDSDGATAGVSSGMVRCPNGRS